MLNVSRKGSYTQSCNGKHVFNQQRFYFLRIQQQHIVSPLNYKNGQCMLAGSKMFVNVGFLFHPSQ